MKKYRYVFEIVLEETEVYRSLSEELTKTYNAIGGEGELQIKSNFAIGTVAVVSKAKLLPAELAKVKNALKTTVEEVYPDRMVSIKHVASIVFHTDK